MGKAIKLAVVFLCVWFSSYPCFSAVLPAPKLSAVQREKDIKINFLFSRPIDFQETMKNNVFSVLFLVQTEAQQERLDQIKRVLPEKLQQIKLTTIGQNLLFSWRLPSDYEAVTFQKGAEISIFVSEKNKIKSLAERISEEFVEFKEKIKPLVTKKTPPKEVKKQAPLSVSLSDPQSFVVKDKKDAQKEQHDSGYRSATLSFPWTRAAALAAFERDGYHWLVFDRKDDFDFSVEREIYKDILIEMIEVPHSQVSIFRIVTAKGYHPSVRREGLLWIVDFMYQPIHAKKPIDLTIQRKSPFGPRILVPLSESLSVLSILDPEIGDVMHIVPVFSLGKGMAKQRSFVDATFLQTVQGLVIVPNVDDLMVFSSTSGIEVRKEEGGMRFSSEDIMTFLAKSNAVKDPLEQVLDVGAWNVSALPEHYLTDLKKLQNAVFKAPKGKKDIQRLILARFYFAKGLYPEALSVLRFLEEKKSPLTKISGFVALRGAVNFMMKRYAEANVDFSSDMLQTNDSVAYWRAANDAARSGSPEDFLEPMRDNMAILQAYPYPIKTRLALAGLAAAVDAHDEFSFQNFIEAAFNSQNSEAEEEEIAFYSALWEEKSALYSLAQEDMEKLALGNNLYFRAMAGLENVRMKTNLNKISFEEKVDELEKLSYAWRGGDFEFNLMLLLANAHKEEKNFGEVLHIYKNMQMRFQHREEMQEIQESMERLFQEIYLDEEKDVLPPVQAIALYNEFKDLMPEGEKGSRIVRRLADRLVAMDLLDAAAMLLEEQLEKKIGAKERSLISTRLALVRLLNKEPEKVLTVLEQSKTQKFSDKVKTQRLYIQAKALSDLKRPQEAVDLLEDDDSMEAKSLRTEIYWEAQMWPEVADTIKYLVSKPNPKVPLTKLEAQRVLNWAVALRLAGRPKVVLRLRENFLPYMEKTELAEAFDFITTAPKQGLMDYQLVAKEIESVEKFHTFAKKYADMVKTKGLSETVK